MKEEKNIGEVVVDRETDQDLNALVAAMIEPRPALVPCRSMHDTASPQGAWVHTHVYEHGDRCEVLPRSFTSDILLAIRVVEHFQKRGYMVSVNASSEGGWWCCMYPPEGDFIEAGMEVSASLAICRAALHAMECLSINNRGNDGQASETE